MVHAVFASMDQYSNTILCSLCRTLDLVEPELLTEIAANVI